MPFENLSEYIEKLENIGELRRVSTEVDPELEVAEVMRRMMYSKNSPALLFENVKGYNIPILGNAFGSIKRLEIALEIKDFSEIGNRIVELTKMKIPSGVLNKIRMLPKLSEISEYGPKIVENGPVQEIFETENASFNRFPILRSFVKDAGRFITFGMTVTRHPDTGIRNLGVYRLQIINDKQAIMHWQIHKRGALHFDISKESKNPIPVAIVIGSDPGTIFSSIAPVPEGMDKFLFAGISRRKGVKLVKCRTIDLEVPANAEIVFEGTVEPSNLELEGPFGDHTGYYTPPDYFPVFTLKGVMCKKKPIYLTTVVGKPILEDAYFGKVIERSFLPLIQMFQPEVVDFSMPPSGWFQGLGIISIRKRYPGQAKKVMMGLWGLGQLSLTKIFIVVDHDVNVHNIEDVIWAVTTKSDPKRDTMIIENVPTDTLDPASPLLNYGSKMGIDATTKWKEEGFFREIQEEVTVDNETKDLVDRKWTQYGLDPNTTIS
ncbi:MAG: menaquinone biosynthesis decarboxylase [Candidatus Nitrosocosmicus sp.]|jgi:4-hydroxy-3-polyprenylbenzoate decarboxylase|nr:menaquinone biosynthesis decarboxylase [Candidatus Nitrosocosmicus sp.]GKS61003.1 menaquinone biosynthesis decarboxylase [Candidatus Nitrosocosmicus sp.]